jgi:hypothetical protein
MATCDSRGLKIVIIIFLIIVTVISFVNFNYHHETSKGTSTTVTAATGTTLKWINLVIGVISGLMVLYITYLLFVGEEGDAYISSKVNEGARRGYSYAGNTARSGYNSAGEYLGGSGGVIPARYFGQPNNGRAMIPDGRLSNSPGWDVSQRQG